MKLTDIINNQNAAVDNANSAIDALADEFDVAIMRTKAAIKKLDAEEKKRLTAFVLAAKKAEGEEGAVNGPMFINTTVDQAIERERLQRRLDILNAKKAELFG